MLYESLGILQIEFPFDMFTVGFDGFHAQVKYFGNLACSATLPDEPENFQFTIGKLFNG